MDCSVQLVGGACGQHGPYTFYKAFRYSRRGARRVVALGEFFFVRLWTDSDLVCIGELQLLWVDRNSDQVLASLRLYFLPENTPEGRMDHGEDEVLAISEKVVLRVDDLITWITMDAEWNWGRLGKSVDSTNEENEEEPVPMSTNLGEGLLDLSDVEVEKKNLLIDTKHSDKSPSVVILSYPRYCRYRAMLKRLEGAEAEHAGRRAVRALGGLAPAAAGGATRVLFCRDTFDYPELEGHELLCNHLAPKLKGRPRGRRKKRSLSPGGGEESNESEGSACGNSAQPSTSGINNNKHMDLSISTRRSTRSDNSEGKVFLRKLTIFMKSNRTPIGRIPSLGYRELDLYALYTKVQKLGGYDSVTANRIWKSIFEELGGNHMSTSAATVIRRHYERFLLPYERHAKGEEYKPLPASARRRLKSKTSSRASTSDADTEGTSGSETGSTTTPPIDITNENNSDLITPSTKEIPISEKGKTSSLRSVRVKSDRSKDSSVKKEQLNPNIVVVNADLEGDVEKIETTVEKIPIVVEKNVEPITSAATPAQNKIREKSPSPVESKEIPIYEIKDKNELEIIEIPGKVIDLESEIYKNISSSNSSNSSSNSSNSSNSLNNSNPNNNNNHNNNNIEVSKTTSETLGDVKQQKLDILKQGGLEVTPVRKEVRPSVIQQVAQPHRVEIIRSHTVVNSGTVGANSKALSDRKQMPPPPIGNVKRGAAETVKLGYLDRRYVNGYVPPKVVQSKSIYVPSEKTVYGDPKDLFRPTIHQVQSPVVFPSSEASRRPAATGLDLTVVRSPQKPSADQPTLPSPFRPYAANLQLNSNLEIKLVASSTSTNTKTSSISPISPISPIQKPTPPNHQVVFQKPIAPPRKRTYSSDSFSPSSKIPKKDLTFAIPQQPQQQQQQQQITSGYGASYPPVMGFPHAGAKAAPPYPTPDVQLMYQSMLGGYLPMYRLPNSSDYLRLYQDLLVQNQRIRVPPFPGFAPESEKKK